MHGGGAFSGKDPTKVDRSAGYMARYVAKNIVAAGLADECLLQLGLLHWSRRSSLRDGEYVRHRKASGRGAVGVGPRRLPAFTAGIIDHLRLREPVYLKTASYGHFGRDEFAWENTDATDELLAKAKHV